MLAVPTIAMGGTLPAAARAVTRAGDVRRHDVATLYGMNTLGAVVGCVVATFSWLDLFGTRQTIWLAAAINLLVAIGARQVDRILAIADRGLRNADSSTIESAIDPQSAIACAARVRSSTPRATCGASTIWRPCRWQPV